MKLIAKFAAKSVKVLIVALPLLTLAFAWVIGWLSPQRSWQEASGWDEIEQLESKLVAAPTLPKITWLGHSGFLLQYPTAKVLLDPILSERCSILPRLVPAPKFALDDIDVVVISHAHFDHLDLPTLEKLSGNPRIVLPKNSEKFLSKKLLERFEVSGLEQRKSLEVAGLEISGVSVQHNGNRYHPFSSEFRALGYVISFRQGQRSHSLYYSGDTGYGPQFAEVKQRFAPQIAILPIGGFEPNFVLKHYHLNPEEAVKAALELEVDLLIPAHFGTFRMAFDRPESALPRFVKAANSNKIDWHLPGLAN